VYEVEETFDLVLHLLERAEDVGIVLRERANPCQPLHHAASLEAMEAPEVGHAHRQVTVAPLGHRVDQTMARAVHGLHTEPKRLVECLGPLLGVLRRLFFDLVLELLEALRGRRHVHVLGVRRQMSRRVEQLVIEDLRGDHLFIAVPGVKRADVLFEEVVDGGAARQEEWRRRRVRVEREQLELFAELAVVALLRFLELFEMRAESLR